LGRWAVTESGIFSKARAIAVLVAVATAAGILGSLTPATSQQPPERTTLIFVDSRRTGFEKVINEGAKGFGAGDWSVFRDPQLDPETCEQAGVVQGRFTAVKRIGAQDAALIVDGAVVLPAGKLTFYFAGKFSDFESEEGLTGAVTGGTGAYRDARGQISLTDGGRQCGEPVDLATVDLLLQ
jgi:hypothetical protein